MGFVNNAKISLLKAKLNKARQLKQMALRSGDREAARQLDEEIRELQETIRAEQQSNL